MAIEHRIKPKFKTKNEAIVARIRAEARVDAPRDPRMAIKKKMAELAYLIALEYGGDWHPAMNPEAGFAVIARQPPSTPTR